MNWFSRHRQEWISECMQVYGFINRKHLMRKFQISPMTAAVDLGTWMTDNLGDAIYDTSKKRYIYTGTLKDLPSEKKGPKDELLNPNLPRQQ